MIQFISYKLECIINQRIEFSKNANDFKISNQTV